VHLICDNLSAHPDRLIVDKSGQRWFGYLTDQRAGRAGLVLVFGVLFRFLIGFLKGAATRSLVLGWVAFLGLLFRAGLLLSLWTTRRIVAFL
jgi:hypothetical protein